MSQDQGIALEEKKTISQKTLRVNILETKDSKPHGRENQEGERGLKRQDKSRRDPLSVGLSIRQSQPHTGYFNGAVW